MSSLAFDAAVFDLDGVLTRTARLHVAAWKEMLDEYLARRSEETGEEQRPFDPEEEYRRYVDGKPRYRGLASFLESRGIELPWGEPAAAPGEETICGLGNRKQEIFLERLGAEGAERIEPMVRLVRALRDEGVATAFATSSRNGRRVVAASGIDELANVVVDGTDLDELGLEGKPAPDLFLEALRRLRIEAGRAILFEDSLAGTRAGRSGCFAVVVGVAEGGRQHRPFLDAGAHLVTDREDPVSVAELDAWLRSSEHRLPSALGHRDGLAAEIGDRRPVFFLDYDGTLTPIVRRPEDAVLGDEMRGVLERLVQRFPVAVVSGRGRPDVEELAGLDGIHYAGSHGFDIAGPEADVTYEAAAGAEPVVEEVTERLEEDLSDIDGAQVEPKRFTVAVHYRRVADWDVSRVEEMVDRIVEEHPGLRKAGGKKVWEIRPDVDWDKGRAVEWLLEAMDLEDGTVPLYLGDDETDEDAFRALARREPPGIGVLVSRVPRPTAASYRLADPGEVREFLEVMAGR